MKPLKAGLADRAPLVRRRSMAALAELLFYLSTTDPTTGSGNPSASWPLAPEIVSDVVHLLRSDDDAVARHYAAKAIDNIATIDGSFWAEQFLSPETAAALVLVRALRCSPALWRRW